MPVLLRVEDACVVYGTMPALRGVSIEVRQGETVCVIGPNGAGKSTLFRAIAGGVRLSRGSVRLDGRETAGQPAERIARLGLSLVPEGRHVFATLSVEENLRLGAFLGRAAGPADERLARVLAYFPRLAERRAASAGGLSGGEQQMLVIGRALMTAPRIVLIDEPSLGLAPKIVDQVYEILLDLKRSAGLTLLINEQSSRRALRSADRIYVLRGGEVRLAGSARDLQDGSAVTSAYFGFEASASPTGAAA